MSGAPLDQAYTFMPSGESMSSSMAPQPSHSHSEATPAFQVSDSTGREPIHIPGPLSIPPPHQQQPHAQHPSMMLPPQRARPPPPVQEMHAAAAAADNRARQQLALESRMRQIAAEESRGNVIMYMVVGAGLAFVLGYLYNQRSRLVAPTSPIPKQI
eukprot:jgi/Mesvir1/4205/Mv22619-RA.1